MGDAMNNIKAAIKGYLDDRAKRDELFAVAYAKDNKTLDECCAYIVGEARKMGGNAVCVADDEVFGWAVHYYDEDDIEVKKLPDAMVSRFPDVELSDEDRELYREQAISEYKRECVAKMRAAEEAKAKRAAAKIEKRRQEASMIPNLFD